MTAICLAAISILTAASAQALTPPLSQWGLHCFCRTARRTPQRIVRADDNALILQLAAHGISRQDLQRRLPSTTDSQLELLQAYALLTKDGEYYTTAFPIFGPEIIGPIRVKLAELARRLVPQLRPEVAAIASHLRKTGKPQFTYAVVFGYALDGLLWDELEKRHLRPDTTLASHEEFRPALEPCTGSRRNSNARASHARTLCAANPCPRPSVVGLPPIARL